MRIFLARPRACDSRESETRLVKEHSRRLTLRGQSQRERKERPRVTNKSARIYYGLLKVRTKQRQKQRDRERKKCSFQELETPIPLTELHSPRRIRERSVCQLRAAVSPWGQSDRKVHNARVARNSSDVSASREYQRNSRKPLTLLFQPALNFTRWNRLLSRETPENPSQFQLVSLCLEPIFIFVRRSSTRFYSYYEQNFYFVRLHALVPIVRSYTGIFYLFLVHLLCI